MIEDKTFNQFPDKVKMMINKYDTLNKTFFIVTYNKLLSDGHKDPLTATFMVLTPISSQYNMLHHLSRVIVNDRRYKLMDKYKEAYELLIDLMDLKIPAGNINVYKVMKPSRLQEIVDHNSKKSGPPLEIVSSGFATKFRYSKDVNSRISTIVNSLRYILLVQRLNIPSITVNHTIDYVYSRIDHSSRITLANVLPLMSDYLDEELNLDKRITAVESGDENTNVILLLHHTKLILDYNASICSRMNLYDRYLNLKKKYL